MLDAVTVLTKGGLVLWSKVYSPLTKGPAANPIDSLVRTVFIEENPTTNADEGFTKDAYQIKWTFANDLGLVFVIVYQKILQLAYIDELLEGFKRLFCQAFADEIRDSTALHDYDLFDDNFETLLHALEAEDKMKQKRKAPRKFEQTKAYQTTLAAQSDTGKADATGDKGAGSRPAVMERVDTLDEKLMALGLGTRKGGKAARRKPGSKSGSGGKNSSAVSSEGSPAPNRSPKPQRTWVNGIAGTASSESLDYSDSKAEDAVASTSDLVGTHLGTRGADGLYDAAEMDGQDSDSEEDIDETSTPLSTPTRGLFSFFQNLTASRKLTREDLDPVMTKMREHMITKNVASDVADHLCTSVMQELTGKEIGRFTSLTKTIKQNLEQSVRKILTPKTSTDLLRDIMVAKQANRPYTITFVGVNGVGKSTNLSKICFWLVKNDLKVLIAACDTFRSGAVEQLRVHQRNLTAVQPGAVVELFDRGYGKDPAGIAKDAIGYAANKGFDVVLVDTAGRMQDNEPLMRALAKLVTLNNPDKIIFVGEALVGNEAVDQLTKFNQALKDFSGVRDPRQIDGIVLSKFDTIDDKVGAALSMTHITGQPILFVGTGQTYTDLRRMNVRSIVGSLLAK
ncbi:SRP54-type protein [Fimicolochytrium jonesii]|uniref:SRP54-type protein n=1 Tax=Fimicolochytrium jonesii TaxID=1396493 RepID=UPI0022FEDF59|nr:SRP54-type protein [Fimicolochytrium jonesii]KAI8826179.1 SRP54-type protein [Fimicolochytrium jonesii]